MAIVPPRAADPPIDMPRDPPRWAQAGRATPATIKATAMRGFMDDIVRLGTTLNPALWLDVVLSGKWCAMEAKGGLWAKEGAGKSARPERGRW
jgi:hypothetical protein